MADPQPGHRRGLARRSSDLDCNGGPHYIGSASRSLYRKNYYRGDGRGSDRQVSQNITVNFTVNSVSPTILSIWPSTLPVNGGAQTITIRGANYYTATVAKLQGVTTALATTVLDSATLLAVIPAASLLTAGNLNVLVENPAPGGDSATSLLTVCKRSHHFGHCGCGQLCCWFREPGPTGVTIFGTQTSDPRCPFQCPSATGMSPPR